MKAYVVIFALVGLLAGCTGLQTMSTATSTASPDAKRLERYALTLDDLPTEFMLAEEKEITPASLAKDSSEPDAALEEYRQQGRLSSVKLRFEKHPTTDEMTHELIGPIGVRNQIIEYKEASGAERGYEQIVRDMQKDEWEIISARRLGDRSTTFRWGVPALVSFMFVVQRRNLISTIQVSGVPPTGISVEDAYRLAEIAAKRLE